MGAYWPFVYLSFGKASQPFALGKKKEYSCFTVLCQFLLYGKVNQLYVYMYSPFFGFPSHLGHRWILSRIPCAVTVKVKSLSRIPLFTTQWAVAHQAPPSTGFSRQEYWSGLPFPSPGYLPDLGIEPRSPALQTDALPSEPAGRPSVVTVGSHYINHVLYT